MATVKGTWKFNDVLTDYAHINENVNYTCNAYSRLFGVEVQANCSGIVVDSDGNLCCYVESTVPDFSANGFSCPRNVIVYRADGWNVGAFEIKDLCIYFGDAPQEVSDEFYEWFTANAVEQKQISGVWKFEDALIAPSADLEQETNFAVESDIPQIGVTTMRCTKIFLYDDGTLEYTISSSEPDLNIYGIPLPFDSAVYAHDNGWLTDYNGEGVKTIDFGTEPQYVSVDFYNWLTENATQPTAAIQYNGVCLAYLFSGQKATLKCAGKTMETDVVVTV